MNEPNILKTKPLPSIYLHLQDSLDYFGERRTDKSQSSKFQGVETPSQVRKYTFASSTRNVYLNHFLN